MSKAYIVVEGPTDAAILRKILPSESLQQVKFIDGEGKYGAVSMARKLLMTEHIPTALVIDAGTDHASMVHEQQDLDYLLRLAADGTPFQILMAVPAIEVLFFQDRGFLEQLLGRTFTDLEWQLASQQPRQLLNTVQGGYQRFVETAIAHLNGEAIAMLRQHPLIQDLIKFLITLEGLSTEAFASS
ncbi:hypothetical protein Q2T42_26065 [Leptolyngbya boryana CZ1]|uniref:Uncharacterized protein n=1 Tax=Leptolyngbya boryana CZ1 TaxID=3060204 RepID=A0AA96WU51_LEPBY|nr:hypothetical protein [Leptolyngbya boryana]WNZ45258.1 hypothetical protein Q2T42_26065 [Leptolyngbya boryana CZ1]